MKGDDGIVRASCFQNRNTLKFRNVSTQTQETLNNTLMRCNARACRLLHDVVAPSTMNQIINACCAECGKEGGVSRKTCTLCMLFKYWGHRKLSANNLCA
jgi:hypothetical protein